MALAVIEIEFYAQTGVDCTIVAVVISSLNIRNCVCLAFGRSQRHQAQTRALPCHRSNDECYLSNCNSFFFYFKRRLNYFRRHLWKRNLRMG